MKKIHTEAGDRWSSCFIPTLNGEKVEYCTIADEEGWVEVYARDSDGQLIRDAENPGLVKRERKTGVVQITLRPDAPQGARDAYAALRGDDVAA